VALLALHDVNDAEAFAAAIANRSRLTLSRDDREDLVQFLLVELWKLSLRYDRGDPKFPPRFGVYATGILQRRVVDWSRSRWGRTKWQFADRTYERKRPELVSLDGDDRDRLGGLVTEGDGDHAPGWDSGLAGLLGEGDRQRDADLETLRGSSPRRIAG
jgi:DNA-directed RNA polymerase specialized sigma24 family protein